MVASVLDISASNGNPYLDDNLVKVVYPSSAAAIKDRLTDIALPETLPFIDTLSIVVSKEDSPSSLKAADINDDMKREEAFYKMALETAVIARRQILKAKVPFSRPNDYFAEMVKNEKLMNRARNLILQKEQEKDAAEKARKQRELKKIGKKVQHEKILQRQRQKKAELNKIELLKKKKNSRN